MTSLPRLNERVICLIDMDCFYVQVEEIAAPEFKGKPCGVSQYNPYKGGGLIAVNYEARKFGIKRGMRGEDAKKLCPEFHTFYVKEKRGKADLSKYREASLKIFEIIVKHCPNVEKASIDEAYLDLTELVNECIQNKKVLSVDLFDSFVVGSYSLVDGNDPKRNLESWLSINSDLTRECSDVSLVIGASIVQEIREDIRNTLGYNCSAGIAQNKTLAKLCCGLNKPNKQTILPPNSIEQLLENIPINKIKNLGGKLGMILNEQLGLKTVGDLSRQSLNDLVKHFGEKTGLWLNQISHGIDLEPVLSRQAAKSIGCSKNFRGKLILNTVHKVNYWVKQLCDELEERLEMDRKMNQRDPTSLVLHITNEAGTFSKTTSLQSGKTTANHFIAQSIEALSGFNKSKSRDEWYPGIYTLGISAAKFIDIDKNKASNQIEKYFNKNKNINEAENDNQAVCSATIQDDNEEDDSESKSTNNSFRSETNSNETTNTNKENTHREEIASTSSNETAKSSNKIDIRTLLMKQKEKVKKEEESDLDAENLTDTEDLVVVDKVSEKKIEKIDDYFKRDTLSQENNIAIENLEEIDYVLCQQCGKKILCWNMPEHEDFHFAQMISRQQASESSIINTKKRSAEENSNETNKNDNQKEKSPKNNKTSKKLKTEKDSSSTKVKSIQNYFKKK